MISTHLRSVGARIVGVILVVALPVAGAMTYVWWQSMQKGRALELSLLRANVAEIDRHLQGLTEQSEWVLSRLAARPAFRRLMPGACDDEMAKLRDVNSAFLAITLWNREGGLVCSSIPPRPDQPVPEPHWKSFKEGLATDGLYLSNVFRGRITNLALVTYTFPVKDDRGVIIGLLSLPLQMSYFDRLLKGVQRPRESVAGILDRDLVIVERIPDNELWQGKSVAALPGVKAGLQASEGAFDTAGVDGITRIFVHKTVPATGWHVYVGIESNVLYADFRKQLINGIVVFAFVLVLSLMLAYLIGRRISRPLAQLASVADAVAAGDHTQRAPVADGSEIDRVAQHMNAMIDALTRTEASLQRSNQRLYEVSSRLLRAEEAERQRLSRDLHDQIGQELTALKLNLESIGRRSDASPELVDRCVQAVSRLLEQVRDITRILRPPQLDKLGLEAALRSHAERNVSVHGITVHFDAAIEAGRLGSDLEAACFRVAQEALTNIVRHSGAKSVWIRLREISGQMVLEIRDDGVGFDLAAASKASSEGRSSGLLNMHDRVELAGGEFEIQPLPGGGTRICASFPLRG